MFRVLLVPVLVLLLAFPAGAAALPKVKIETSLGDIVVELDSAKAPETVRNFLVYVKSGFYKDTIFHRVINGFMIQGGGFDQTMRQKAPTRKPIANEASNRLPNKAYTIAMARTSDPHSASSQFFINVADNPGLNYRASTQDGYGYAVFGKVVQGMDVVDKIKMVPTGRSGQHENVPLTPVVIKDIVLLP